MCCQSQSIMVAAFGSTDDLGLDLKSIRCIDDGFGMLVGNVDLHPLPHVKDLVHFFIAGLRSCLDGFENGGHGNQLIFDVVHFLPEFEALGERAPRAMDEAFNIGPEFAKQMFHDRCVTACWAQ